jgi:hypothetical protein
MGGAGQDAWEGSAVCALAWVGSRGGAGAVELDLLGVKCERRERWWWVGGRTRSGEGVVAGRSNLRQGAVRKRREQPAATGGRTARVAESQIRRFSDVQIFSIFRPHRPQTARCNNLPPRCCTPGQWGADSASGNGRESFPPASKQARGHLGLVQLRHPAPPALLPRSLLDARIIGGCPLCCNNVCGLQV